MMAVALILLVMIIISATILVSMILGKSTKYKKVSKNNIETISSDLLLVNGSTILTKYLTPNQYSRPKLRLNNVNGIVIHYTANPGTSAEANRNYFEGLATKKTTYASSHFVIGLEGEILQCIPLTEEAFASNNRNVDTISIECCHPDKTGKFNQKTYHSLVNLVAALCVTYDLKENDIIRHYDVTKKLCPLYYVKHEDAWKTLRKDIMKEVDNIDTVRKGNISN